MTGWVREVAAAAVSTLALVLLGAPVGWVWAHQVPHVGLVAFPDGAVTVGAAEGLVRADMLFALITVAVGLVCGFVAWLLSRRVGWGVALGLAAGGFAASLVARTVGQRVLHQSLDPRLKEKFDITPTRHVHILAPPLAHGVLVGWAFAAVVVFFLLAALRGLRER